MSTEIMKIDRYGSIIKYLFLEGLQDEEIYKVMFKTLDNASPKYAHATIGLHLLGKVNK